MPVLKLLLLCLCWSAEQPPPAQVVLRTTEGPFLRPGEGSTLRSDQSMPDARSVFRLTPLAAGSFAIHAPDGRMLAPSAGSLALVAEAAAPLAVFRLVAAADKRTLLRPAAGEAQPARQGGLVGPPPPAAEVEVFQAVEIPDGLRAVLGLAIQALALEELGDKEYQKQRTRQRQRFVELPAPVLGDLKRTRRQRLFSVTEQYDLKARLSAAPVVQVHRLPYLKAYARPSAGLLLFALRGELPVAGQAHYEIPGTLSATTNYRACVTLDALGDVRLEKSGDRLVLGAPRLLKLKVVVERLDLSNDVLQAARSLVEDALNHELRKNEERIRDKANRSIAKGMETREFQHPLLRLIALP